MWQTILDDISQRGPELAGCIRQRMWLFEDIARLADQDIACLLKNVETSQWAIAFQGASEELREKIYKNVSKRAAKMLQEEIEYHSSCKQADIENVRCEIVYIMQRLEDSGEIRKGNVKPISNTTDTLHSNARNALKAAGSFVG